MQNWIIKFDKLLDRLIYYKGINQEILQYKKTYWLAILVVALYVAFMTILAYRLNASSLVLYGNLLNGWYIPFLIAFALLPFKLEWLVHVSQHWAIVLTFFIVAKLGGIPYCGGIIIAPINSVVFSVLFYKIRWSVWYFVFFLICLFASFATQNILDIPPEMPQQVNQLFYLINTVFLCALTLVVVLVYLNQYTQYEKDRANQLAELDDAKTRLYTNISHEFRTPLTIILGTANQIEEEPRKWLREGIIKIRQNSAVLLNLVNQMLNLSRLEAGALPINMIQADIVKFLKVIFESFHSLADNKRLKMLFTTETESLIMDFDSEKIQLIVSNLLSNAIKYSKKDGIVSLNLTMTENNRQILIQIKDSGIGIEEKNLAHIFDRFYRIEEATSHQTEGAGLGLAITKEMTNLLGGQIEVESVPDSGSLFRVYLPVFNNAPYKDALELRSDLLKNQLHKKTSLRDIQSETTSNDKPVLLIVEDNSDVTEYLESILYDEYKVISAENGRKGLEKAQRKIPDIVVSDVMMPEMDGLTMLRKLKNDIRTSHIPVILLTAKADIESKLEGLDFGAEAYLEKPFNKVELLIRIEKLIELRQHLRARYSSFNWQEWSKETAYSKEDSFITKIHRIFGENIKDENFGIKQLCERMNMSRAQLYRKLRALTNYSVKEYMNLFRLHMARELLFTSELNVTQVAYEVGFKSLSHFSKKFHRHFGINPSQFIQNQADEII